MVANYKRLGNAAFKAKEYPKAIFHYEKAVNIDPEDTSCWGNLAAILLESKAFSEVGDLCICILDEIFPSECFGWQKGSKRWLHGWGSQWSVGEGENEDREGQIGGSRGVTAQKGRG